MSGRLSKFTPRSDRAMLREIAKRPRSTHQTQASVNLLNVEVYAIAIRNGLKYEHGTWLHSFDLQHFT